MADVQLLISWLLLPMGLYNTLPFSIVPFIDVCSPLLGNHFSYIIGEGFILLHTKASTNYLSLLAAATNGLSPLTAATNGLSVTSHSCHK
jgi:hypothetical protein